jgi:hypothetical protein
MTDNNNPNTVGADDDTTAGGADESWRHDTWLIRNTGPILAIGTVVLTFIMFAYFVCLTNKPSRESLELRCAATALADAESKFSQISSAKTGKIAPVKREEARKERDNLKIQVSNARLAVDEAKERRGMMKDFVLYILGVLSSALTTIFGFYFGSSKGSSDKSKALNKIATRSPQPGQPGKQGEQGKQGEKGDKGQQAE